VMKLSKVFVVASMFSIIVTQEGRQRSCKPRKLRNKLDVHL
jgi:hypothetical protein